MITPSTIKPEISQYQNRLGTDNSGSCVSGVSVVVIQDEVRSESIELTSQSTLSTAQQKAFLRTMKKHKKGLDLLAE